MNSKGTGGIKKRVRKDGTVAYLMQYMMGGKTYSKTAAAKTEAQAKKELPLFVAAVRRGEHQEEKSEIARFKSEPTFAEWAAYFIENKTTVDKDRIATKRAYTNCLNTHLVPYLGHLKLSEVTGDQISVRLRRMLDEGKAVATIKLTHTVARICFGKACKDKKGNGHIDTNPVEPFKELKLPEAETAAVRSKRTSLKVEQIGALLPHLADDPEIELYTWIMMATGMRPGEAAAVQIGSINFEALQIEITGSVKIDGKERRIGEPKNKYSRRVVGVGPALADKIKAHIADMERLQRQMRRLPADVPTVPPLLGPDVLLFCNDPSTPAGLRTPQDPRNLRERFKRRVKRAALQGVTPHWMRHTAITHGLAAGVPIAEVAKRAGHASAAITLEVYCHALDERQRASAAAGDSLLSTPPTPKITDMRTKG